MAWYWWVLGFYVLIGSIGCIGLYRERSRRGAFTIRTENYLSGLDRSAFISKKYLATFFVAPIQLVIFGVPLVILGTILVIGNWTKRRKN